MSFFCDECDGLIDDGDEYIEAFGLNYCWECVDEHTEIAIDKIHCPCGNVIKKGEYFHIWDNEVVCDKCFELNSIKRVEGED